MLQQWLTVGGAVSVVGLQGEDHYLDLGAYRDIVVYPEIGFSTSGTTLAVQTSPIKDGAMFSNMASWVPTGTGTLTPAVVQFASSSVPLARYVRWRISNSSAWSVTFRIWVRVTGNRNRYDDATEEDDIIEADAGARMDPGVAARAAARRDLMQIAQRQRR